WRRVQQPRYQAATHGFRVLTVATRLAAAGTLATRAAPGPARRVAELVRRDRRAAPRTRLARPGGGGERPSSVDALLHELAGGLVELHEHVLRQVAHERPRVDATREARLGLPDVADPGRDALVEQHLADRALRMRARAARGVAAIEAA